jgi:xanthine dehydrogenase accessory factor
MKDLYLEIIQELGQGRPVILATMISQKGSAPRTQGTQFLIRSDGTFLGSIGGGRMEADVLKAAPSVFKQQTSRIISFRLKGEEAAETEMICGGEVDIYLEPFAGSNPQDRELFEKVLDLWERSQTGLLATLIQEGLPSDQANRKALLIPEELPHLNAIPWIKPFLEDHPNVLENQSRLPAGTLTTKEGAKILLERLTRPPQLYIFGAGHISLYLCALTKLVGFQVTLFDDRVDFANPQRFPEADAIVVRSFEEILAQHSFDAEAYLVIVTRGHLHDYQIVRQLLKAPHRYVGMIGSRHKRAVIFKALADDGFTESQIQSIHSPIGLDIYAETPEEIAVSITAELIQVRREGQTRKRRIG